MTQAPPSNNGNGKHAPAASAPTPDQTPGVILNGPHGVQPKVLLVGEPSRMGQVRAMLAAADAQVRIVSAADYLVAMGMAPSLSPDLVIGRLDGLDSMGDSIIAGLRRLAPQAKLAAIAPTSHRDQPNHAAPPGLDQYLAEPVALADIEALLNHPPKPPASPAGPQADSSTATAPPPRVPTPEPDRDPAPSPASMPLDDAGLFADSLGELAAVDAELGDVDLIDQLLRNPAGLEATAMRLISAQSQIGGIAFTTDADQVPPGRAHSSVEYHGRRLGVLHAPPPATPQVLRSWASWLAHWLSLKARFTGLWEMAAKDDLTGAYNRRYFDRYLARLLARASARRSPVTLLVFDIDDFKTYNDRYGHPAGDEILKQTVKLMRSVVREHDVVARIGGDEFAVIFWDSTGPRKPNSSHPDDVKLAAQRFQHAICQHHFPKLYDQAPGTLTISGGLASFPWDGSTPDALVERADAMLLHSKRQGKNAITFGPGAARACDLPAKP